MPRPPSLLLIEPKDDSRVMYAEDLHTFGFTVLTADTTDDGLIRASDADVIVTGIRVPGSFDGVELVRRVRQTEKTTHTRVIVVLTAYAFESDGQRAFAAGCDLFLPKHCPPERLVREIRAVLRRRRMPTPQPATRAHEPPQPLLLPVEEARDAVQNAPSEMRRGGRSLEGAVMPTRTTPDDGDIVVRRERRDGTLVYVLHTAPGADQSLLRTREEAVSQALASAKREHVRTWLTTDESYDFVRLGAGEGHRHTTLERLRAEFMEMPGLRLRAAQAQRLCGVDRTMCQMMLDALVNEKFLCVKSDGHYARLTTGHHPHPAKADLRTDTRFPKAS